MIRSMAVSFQGQAIASSATYRIPDGEKHQNMETRIPPGSQRANEESDYVKKQLSALGKFKVKTPADAVDPSNLPRKPHIAQVRTCAYNSSPNQFCPVADSYSGLRGAPCSLARLTDSGSCRATPGTFGGLYIIRR